MNPATNSCSCSLKLTLIEPTIHCPAILHLLTILFNYNSSLDCIRDNISSDSALLNWCLFDPEQNLCGNCVASRINSISLLIKCPNSDNSTYQYPYTMKQSNSWKIKKKPLSWLASNNSTLKQSSQISFPGSRGIWKSSISDRKKSKVERNLFSLLKWKESNRIAAAALIENSNANKLQEKKKTIEKEKSKRWCR